MDQRGGPTAQHDFGGPPEQMLNRRRYPVDGPGQRDQEDRVGGVLGQQPISPFRVGKGRRGRDLVGRIGHDQEQQDAVRVLDRRGVHSNLADGAVRQAVREHERAAPPSSAGDRTIPGSDTAVTVPGAQQRDEHNGVCAPEQQRAELS